MCDRYHWKLQTQISIFQLSGHSMIVVVSGLVWRSNRTNLPSLATRSYTSQCQPWWLCYTEGSCWWKRRGRRPVGLFQWCWPPLSLLFCVPWLVLRGTLPLELSKEWCRTVCLTDWYCELLNGENNTPLELELETREERKKESERSDGEMARKREREKHYGVRHVTRCKSVYLKTAGGSRKEYSEQKKIFKFLLFFFPHTSDFPVYRIFFLRPILSYPMLSLSQRTE